VAALRFIARAVLAVEPKASGLRIDVEVGSTDGDLVPRAILVDGHAATHEAEDVDPALWDACRQLAPGELLARYARRDPRSRTAFLMDLHAAKSAALRQHMSAHAPRATAIDPVGCGCTACISGEHTPLDQASAEQVAAMVRGEIHDNTRADLEVAVIVRLRGASVLEYEIDPAQLRPLEVGDDSHLPMR
jgi:hypothetical protein